jgi:pimeloyl-ACP methyl ester carboxylesterase
MPDTERHEIAVADGQSVVAVHHPAERADADWLVHCHGFASDRTGSYESRCERAVAEGYHGVRFDFRGCGEADGEFAAATLSARIADLRAVLDQFDPPAGSVVLFGSSFGGKTALHAAAGDGPTGPGEGQTGTGTTDDRIAAVATRAPVTYGRAFDPLADAVREQGTVEYAPGFPVDERLVDDLAGYEFADVAEPLDVPVAVFHGREDDSVPLADSLDAVGALATDASLWAYADEGHRFSRDAEARMRDALFDWLARRDPA